MYVGPNINADNLLFGYDMDDRGNRFYRGEPTVNYASNTVSSYTNYYQYLRDGENHICYRHQTSSSKTLALQCTSFTSTLTSGDTYSISGYVFFNNEPFKITVSHLSTYHTNTLSKYSDDNGFFKYTQTFNSGDWLIHNILCNAETGDTITIKNLQIEKKSHSTQFLPSGSTRTNTSSLYNLKTKAPINVSTLSFDSKALPYFDGLTNNLTLSGLENLNKNFTVCAWIYITSYVSDTNVGQTIFQQYGGSKGWFFSLVGPTAKLQLRHHNVTATTYNLIYATSLNLNTWYFVSASDDGSTVKIYLNGNVVASRASSISVASVSPSYVGTFGSGYYCFNGKINSLLLFNKTISDFDVKSIYSSFKNKYNYLT